jgi:hypothetical protein
MRKRRRMSKRRRSVGLQHKSLGLHDGLTLGRA